VTFLNTYEEACRASAYDELGLGGTYQLVFDNLPGLLRQHVAGARAVDFGCGTGRSARFLKGQGFRVTGLDISSEMLAIARSRDPEGDYRLIADGDLSSLEQGCADLVLSAFTFDNVEGYRHKVRLFAALRRLLAPAGRLVNVVSTPEIYTHEWVTFSTRDYPENARATSGDVVRIVTTEYSDARPVEDILFHDRDYRSVYREAGLEPEHIERPLARGNEGVQWVSETRVAPWAIYVLRSMATDGRRRARGSGRANPRYGGDGPIAAGE